MKCDIIAIIQLIAPNNCRLFWASCSSCFSSFAILSLSNSSYFFLALSWAFINSLILLADAFSALSNFVVLFFFGKIFTVIRTRRYWVAEWWVYYGAADSGGRSCGVAESGGAAESNDRSCRSADSSGSCGWLTVVAGAVEKLDVTLWISQLFFHFHHWHPQLWHNYSLLRIQDVDCCNGSSASHYNIMFCEKQKIGYIDILLI